MQRIFTLNSDQTDLNQDQNIDPRLCSLVWETKLQAGQYSFAHNSFYKAPKDEASTQ